MKKYLLILFLFSSCAMFRTQPMSQPAISGKTNTMEFGNRIDARPLLINPMTYQGVSIMYPDSHYISNFPINEPNSDTLPANLLVSILEKPLAVEDQQFGDLYTVFTMRGYVVGNKVFFPDLSYLDGSKKKLPKSVIVWNYKQIDK